MNLDQLTDAVIKKLQADLPRARLIGTMPDVYNNYNYVNNEPYEAVVIGAISPAQLLQMPNDIVCKALLENKPVYFCGEQLWKKSRSARALCRELAAAEQRLYRLGVLPMETAGRLLTAKEARAMRQSGKTPGSNCRMTPLARDILEGKEP